MALQRINQELEDKLYRMVRPQRTLSPHSVPPCGRCCQNKTELGSREAKPVQAAQRMATGF